MFLDAYFTVASLAIAIYQCSRLYWVAPPKAPNVLLAIALALVVAFHLIPVYSSSSICGYAPMACLVGALSMSQGAMYFESRNTAHLLATRAALFLISLGIFAACLRYDILLGLYGALGLVHIGRALFFLMCGARMTQVADIVVLWHAIFICAFYVLLLGAPCGTARVACPVLVTLLVGTAAKYGPSRKWGKCDAAAACTRILVHVPTTSPDNARPPVAVAPMGVDNTFSPLQNDDTDHIT